MLTLLKKKTENELALELTYCFVWLVGWAKPKRPGIQN
jgi:hypothetical protein